MGQQWVRLEIQELFVLNFKIKNKMIFINKMTLPIVKELLSVKGIILLISLIALGMSIAAIVTVCPDRFANCIVTHEIDNDKHFTDQ